MIRRPPRSTRTDTRFPDTTLFRSVALAVCENVRPGTICATSARFDICWFFSASPLIAETERPTSCRFWLRLLAVTMISSPEPAAGPSCPHAGTANAAETAHVTSAKDLTSLINLSLHFIVLLIFAWKKTREARLLSTRIIADLIFSVKHKLVCLQIFHIEIGRPSSRERVFQYV